MVLIPAGEFWMGRVHSFFFDSLNFVPRPRMDDQPANKVYVDGLYMDTHEVTNAEYVQFLEATDGQTPWHWPQGEIPEGDEQLPVANVNWFEADAFCKWVGKRLPTEAEREKAARGGLDRARYAWGDAHVAQTDERALFIQSPLGMDITSTSVAVLGHNKPRAVGSLEPNGYGLYDMIGNVSEWVNDWYDGDYYVFMPKENPQGPETGRYKGLRGNSWSHGRAGDHLMNSFRDFTDPEFRMPTIGFRCAQAQ